MKRVAMQKVAVFGNAGGGKSTLSKRLSQITGLPLYPLDKIKYLPGGAEVPYEDYKRNHEKVLATDQWIIDGFGCIETVWPRLDAADTLVYVDLPLYMHFWFVTKRFITGYFKQPEGWPEKSSIWKGSINSYRVLQLCHERLTPKYRQYIEQAKSTKSVYHITSTKQIEPFFESISTEASFKNSSSA
jgi:adenylate kinase family enzyme